MTKKKKMQDGKDVKNRHAASLQAFTRCLFSSVSSTEGFPTSPSKYISLKGALQFFSMTCIMGLSFSKVSM